MRCFMRVDSRCLVRLVGADEAADATRRVSREGRLERKTSSGDMVGS
jgi:hypothetical protein